jgi:putative queuosine salvage protein
MGSLDEVRRSARDIAEAATWVRINQHRIESYARSLPIDRARAPELDPETHYVGERAPTLAYVVTLDAINFGSGYFPHLRKRDGMSGYFTVASSLKDEFERHGPLPLGELTQEACARMFGQSLEDDAVAELMGLFAQALNDLGHFVDRQGGFEGIVKSSQGSAERLAESLTEMPFYRDTGFLKRAQLTAADLSVAHVADFGDLDRLTIFADNLVPHVLRLDGVLEYRPELIARIEQEELIAAGSPEEREIRAGALHAVEMMVAALDGAVTAMQLDYVLWNRGQQPSYKAVPRHRARTVYY